MMEDVATKLASLEQREKSNTHRIDKLEERQDNLEKLTDTISVLANEQEHIKSDVGEIKADVKTLTDKPGKRWDAMIDKASWAFVGGAIAFALSQIF